MNRIGAYFWLPVLSGLLFMLTGCNYWADISQREIREKRQQIVAGSVLIRLQLDGREPQIVLPRKIDDNDIVGLDYYAGPALIRFPITRIKSAKLRVDLSSEREALRTTAIIVGTTGGVLLGLTLVGGLVYISSLGAGPT